MMSGWISIRSLMPWVGAPPYLLANERYEDTARVLDEADFTVWQADLTRVVDEVTLLESIFGAMHASESSHCNWQALDDRLGEQQSGPGGSVALVLENADALLEANPRALIRGVHILQSLSEQAEAAAHSTGFQFEVFHFGQFGSVL